jgi:hypothetical protein
MKEYAAGVAGLTLFALLVTAGVAMAAPPGAQDPNWPCEQIKVPQLSLASVWSGPALDRQAGDWREDPQVVELVGALAQRRLPINEAQQRIHAFAAQAGEQKQPKLLAILSGVFSLLDDERSAVIAGLDRFGARQKELAANLREESEKLRVMQADPEAKASDVATMTEQISWEAQVFQDRRQAVRYACEVPGKIEQRLFSLTRAVQGALQ